MTPKISPEESKLLMRPIQIPYGPNRTYHLMQKARDVPPHIWAHFHFIERRAGMLEYFGLTCTQDGEDYWYFGINMSGDVYVGRGIDAKHMAVVELGHIDTNSEGYWGTMNQNLCMPTTFGPSHHLTIVLKKMVTFWRRNAN